MIGMMLIVAAGVSAALAAFGVGGRVHLGWLAVALLAFGLALG